MHSPQTRDNLEHCRAVLASVDTSDEMRQLASNLIHHLLEMHDAGRMRRSVLLLALDSLELVPGLEASVGALREAAGRDEVSQSGAG